MGRGFRQVGLDGTEYRMRLGEKPNHGYPGFAEFIDYRTMEARYWPEPLARYFERIGWRRYRKFQPYRPGCYSTARWGPYSGYGRFSGLREILDGHYYAERYTGVRKRPDDYLKRAA